jgi:PhoH-like ATPase
VVLITKDVNLRMKAKAIGVHADDYNTDKITVDALEDSGIRHIEHLSSEQIQRLYEAEAGLEHSELALNPEPSSNEFFIFKAPSRSVLATYDESSQHMVKIQRRDVQRIRPRNAEQVFSVDALLNPNILLVALSGKAGTGKTLLTMAAALAMESSYSQIFLSRPIIPMGNRDIGYLPGSANAKMDPYIKPLYDNLSVIEQQQDQKGKDRIKRLMDSDRLKISPLAYIRGRSLANTFFIVDEAQNLTPHEVKTIITRAGQGTKIVLTGDIHQIDHPYLDTESNGLSYVIEKMKGQPLFAHVRLQKGERSALADLGSDLL